MSNVLCGCYYCKVAMIVSTVLLGHLARNNLLCMLFRRIEQPLICLHFFFFSSRAFHYRMTWSIVLKSGLHRVLSLRPFRFSSGLFRLQTMALYSGDYYIGYFWLTCSDVDCCFERFLNLIYSILSPSRFQYLTVILAVKKPLK